MVAPPRRIFLVRADGTHKAAWDAYVAETMRP